MTNPREKSLQGFSFLLQNESENRSFIIFFNGGVVYMKIYTDRKLKTIFTDEFHRLHAKRQMFANEALALIKEHEDPARYEEELKKCEAQIDYLTYLMRKLGVL